MSFSFRKFNVGRYLCFLLIAFMSVVMFETLPRLILKKFFGESEAQYLWENPRGGYIFIFWYAAIFSILYFLFHAKAVSRPVITGIALGMLAETVVFKNMNAVSFLVFPFLYGMMFYIPFKLIRSIRWRKSS